MHTLSNKLVQVDPLATAALRNVESIDPVNSLTRGYALRSNMDLGSSKQAMQKADKI